MVSAICQTMIDQIIELRSVFLGFETANQFEDINQYKLKSFIVFAHSSFENYFESISKELLDKSNCDWQASKRLNPVLLKLLIYSSENYSGNPDMNVEKRIVYNYNRQKHVISSNNGIKKEDICSLLFPVGFKESDFVADWLSTINSFGTWRGSIAHTNIGIKRTFEVKLVNTTINAIISGIVYSIDSRYISLKTLSEHDLLVSNN